MPRKKCEHACADRTKAEHTGLEHLSTVRDVWHGIPDHKTLHLRWWFVPAAEVPTGRDERIAWLFDRWAEIDTWIGDQQLDPPQ